MDIRIPAIPTEGTAPIDKESYLEVAVPDGSSASGYTSQKVKLKNLSYVKTLKLSFIDNLTADPTSIEHVNTLGTVTLVRNSAGHYTIQSSGLFTLSKTFILLSATSVVNSPNITYYQTDASNIEIYARNSAGTLTDGILSEDDTHTNILIEVYP